MLQKRVGSQPKAIAARYPMSNVAGKAIQHILGCISIIIHIPPMRLSSKDWCHRALWPERRLFWSCSGALCFSFVGQEVARLFLTPPESCGKHSITILRNIWSRNFPCCPFRANQPIRNATQVDGNVSSSTCSSEAFLISFEQTTNRQLTDN